MSWLREMFRSFWRQIAGGFVYAGGYPRPDNERRMGESEKAWRERTKQ